MDEARKEIIRKSLKEFTPNPNNIDGIFNHCDRWCERCKFKSRCTQWQMENSTQQGGDQSMEDTLEYVSLVMQDTIKSIYDELEERGVDISEVNNIKKEVKNRELPLEKMGRDYFKDVMQWLERNTEGLNACTEKYAVISIERAEALTDALEIINWYMSMIGVKISRALRSNPYEDADDAFLLYDRIGIGRLIIVCIEKSIQAFMFLMGNYPAGEDDILDFLSRLAKMREGIYVEIPQAKDYRRPYLDD